MNILSRLGKYSLYRIQEYVPATLILWVGTAWQTTSNAGKKSEVLIKNSWDFREWIILDKRY